MDKKLTVEQAAKILRVSSKTLRRWEEAGYLIPSRTSGSHRRYTEDQLLAFKGQKYSRSKGDIKSASSKPFDSYSNLQTPVSVNSAEKIHELLGRGIRKSFFKERIPVAFAYLSSLDRKKRLFLAGLFSVFTLALISNITLKTAFKGNQNLQEQNGLVFSQPTSEAVLGTSTDPGFTFKVNVPAEFGKEATFTNGITIQGQLVLESAEDQGNTVVVTNNGSMDLGIGSLTASNVIYSITAGDGITISTGQKPTITNSDKGSSQNIFKNIKIGGSTISSGSNTDTLEFSAGTGISLAADTTNKKVTITGESSGWTHSGTYTILNTITDSVGIGIAAPTSKLHVVGNSNLAGDVVLGSSTSDDITFTGRVSSDIIPSATGTYSLGSDSYRWSQLYLTGVVAVGGQATFTSEPTGSGVGEGAIYINPPSVDDTDYTLFGIAVGGIEKLRMDATGNIAVQGDFLGPTTGSVGYWTRSDEQILAPYSTGDSIFTTGSIGAGTPSAAFKLSVTGDAGLSPFNIASSSGTSLFNVAANGNVGVGTIAPGASRLKIVGTTSDSTGYAFYSQNSAGSAVVYLRNDGIFYSSTGMYIAGSLSSISSGAQITFATGGQLSGNIIIDGSTSGGTTGSIELKPKASVGSVYVSQGNFGVGTTTPLEKLSIIGNATISGNLTLSGAARAIQTTANNTLTIGGDTTGNIILSPLNENGGVGIGDTAPKFKLSVSGNTGTNGLAVFNQTGSGDILSASASGNAKFTIDSSGNVGIGTRTMTSALNIYGSATVFNYGAFQGSTNNPVYLAGNASGTIQTGISSIVAPYNQWIINTSGTSMGLQTIPKFGGAGAHSNQNGTYVALGVTPIYNQLSGTGSNTDLLINRTETLLTSGSQYLIDAQVNSVSKFNLTNAGVAYFVGSIGIGTTSPDSILEVVGAAGATQFRLTSTDGSMYTDFKTDEMGNLSIAPSGGLATFSGRLSLGSGGSRTYATGVDDFFVVGDIENDGLLYSPEIRSADFRLLGASIISGTSLNPVLFGAQATALKFRTSGADNIVYMSSIGHVGVGTGSANFKLDVYDTQSATSTAMLTNLDTGSGADVLSLKIAGTSAETGNNFLTFLNGNGEIIGKVNGNGSGGVTYGTTGIDFAEYFPKLNSEEEFPAGTVICNQNGKATACNDSAKNVLGVVSDRAGFVGGTQHQDDPNYVAVGLVGQLRVRISNNNGEIKAGDPLTSSSDNGVAIKATSKGNILGYALEDSRDIDGNQRDLIMVNVNPGFFDPVTSIAENMSSDEFQSLVDRVSYLENLISIQASASSSFVDLMSQTVGQSASSAAELFSDIEADNLTLNNNATIFGNLIVGGRSVVNDLGVTGNLTLGVINIKPDGQISALGQDLKLQPDQTGGIDILAGKITIQKDGTATFFENAIFEKDVIIKGVLSAESIKVASDKSAGSAVLPEGEASLKIESSEMKSDSKVLVTPNTTIDIPLTVSEKEDGSFTITISVPQTKEVKFDWLIIN